MVSLFGMIRNYNIGRVHLLHRDYGSCRRLAFSVQSYLWSIHIQYHRYDVFTKERSGANSHNEDWSVWSQQRDSRLVLAGPSCPAGEGGDTQHQADHLQLRSTFIFNLLSFKLGTSWLLIFFYSIFQHFTTFHFHHFMVLKLKFHV